MSIIQKYIIKNVLISTALTFMVVLALSFIIDLLAELKNVGEGDYGFLQVVIHEIWRLPIVMYQFFPMLVLLGGVLGLEILASHNELSVMRAAGVSLWRIVGAVVSAALILIVMATLIGELVAPQANYMAEKRKALLQSQGQAVVTQSGIWIHEGNNFLHIDDIIGPRYLADITRYEFDNQHRLLASYFAETLHFQQKHWLARDVVKTTISNKKTTSQKISSEIWDLKLTPTLLNVGLTRPDLMSLPKLKEYSHYLIQNHLQAGTFLLEFWQRISQPLATLVMILLAVPFVFVAPRSITMGRRILFAITIGFLFYILNAFFGEISLVLQFSPIIAAFAPALLFATIGFIWMWRKV